MSNDRRNAIVTGAASGLGRAIALRLARDGWRIALIDINDEQNVETLRLVRATGGEGTTHHVDVSQPAAWEALRDTLTTEWRDLDLLVNNAGVAGSGAVGDYSIADWQWILSINLNAGIYGCHTFIPWLKRNPRGSHIINIASLAAVASKPGMAGYNVAKAGMLSLSESIYGELKHDNVGVTVVCPSFFQTNLLNSSRVQETDRRRGEQIMKKSTITADDVADAALLGMYKKRLYVVVPHQARFLWRVKRLFPMLICNLLARDWDRQLAAESRRAARTATKSSESDSSATGASDGDSSAANMPEAT